MTDQAVGEANAIRAVVVLTDGQANTGTTRLDSLVTMMSRNEVAIRQFGGFQNEMGIDQGGRLCWQARNYRSGTGNWDQPSGADFFHRDRG